LALQNLIPDCQNITLLSAVKKNKYNSFRNKKGKTVSEAQKLQIAASFQSALPT